MILPIVKNQIDIDGICSVPKDLTCYGSCKIGRLGATALTTFAAGITLADEDAFVRFEYDDSLDNKPEIYRVSVSADNIKVGFRDERGAVNGAATVALLLRKPELAQCEIVDYPSSAYRSFLLDMARGLPTEEDIENAVKYMALAKYNRLHLHLIDSNGPCYVSKALPEFKFIGKGEQCTLEYLRKLDRLCASYAIEIVPELEVPAHGAAVCKAHPEFKCLVENATDWAICPGNDDVWGFFEKLTREIAETFPNSEYIHIGTDELDFADFNPPVLSHWDACPRCAALREREGLADKQAEFYYVVEKMHGIVKSCGKKMMMWNDQIDVSKDVPISRDILIEFWRIASPGRGPYEGCTFNGFLEKGFKVINAHYPSTYLDQNRYLSTDKMKTWTPFNSPEQSPEYASQVIGGETCAWEFGNYEDYPFYGVVTPPVLAIFGDKLWGLGEREYDSEYEAAMAEFIFGTAERTDVFECFGNMIPPRNVDFMTYHTEDTLPREKIARCISELEKCDGWAARKYVPWMKKIIDKVLI